MHIVNCIFVFIGVYYSMVMKMNEKLNPRSRNWAMILYPDDEKHVFLLSYFPNYYRCTWILHDKDIYTEKSKSVLSGEHKAGEDLYTMACGQMAGVSGGRAKKSTLSFCYSV